MISIMFGMLNTKYLCIDRDFQATGIVVVPTQHESRFMLCRHCQNLPDQPKLTGLCINCLFFFFLSSLDLSMHDLNLNNSTMV